ncbi:shematrin-like protein 2 [Eublepharis macularius]|uniref:Shematrin-like protein 2 n=1 Tax=Eublepharis macularius TaxID=481883 RepID=A0AA97J117_EUBMA|nr:shematrin-like protein 2 [Eublepharis macularius]
MAYCGPSYAVPSCASAPVVGFGSAGLGYGGFGSAGLGYSGLGLGSVYGHGPLVGSGVPSVHLGTLSGVEPSCINQIPPAEVLIQPPACVVTIPGPILSATGEPVSVGGNTPCAVTYGGPSPIGIAGLGAGALGAGALGRRYGSGSRSSLLLGRRGSACLPPC